MTAWLRSTWLGIQGSYWFYPALFSIAAVILSQATIIFDRNGGNDALANSAWFVPVNADGARNILNVIAGSMIGVASTVFSITIAAVAYASGNYGPRLLSNFMNDRGNQLSLATFISTFVYAVMVLRVIRSPEEGDLLTAAATMLDTDSVAFVPQISLVVATLLMGLSVAVLVYFLNHVPASIRINTVLHSIGEELLTQIDKRFPADESDGEPEAPSNGIPIHCDRTGYIRIVDFRRLGKAAEKAGHPIALTVRPGDFVHPDIAVALLCATNDDLDEDAIARVANEVRDSISTAAQRSTAQDIEFMIDEIVEIALRALSPGINDPFTAITAMHWAGAAMAEIGGRGLDRGPEWEDYDAQWVFPLADNFDHFLGRSFGSMRSAVATSPLAARNFLTSLAQAAVGASSRERIGKLRAEGERLVEQARTVLKGPDLADLEDRYRLFGREMALLVAAKPA